MPVILEYSPPTRLVWKGKLLFSGLFAGKHYFQVIENSEGTTLLRHGEVFSGLLVRLFGFEQLFAQTKAGFEMMNTALKDKAER